MKEFIDKLIERLEEELKLADEVKEKCARENPLMFDNAKGYSTGIANAKHFVKELAEEHNGGWIPCSERLPGEYEYALVWCKGYFASGTHIGEECQWYGIGLLYNKNKWEVCQCKDIKDIEVLGWQPLPEPYKECEKQ